VSFALSGGSAAGRATRIFTGSKRMREVSSPFAATQQNEGCADHRRPLQGSFLPTSTRDHVGKKQGRCRTSSVRAVIAAPNPIERTVGPLCQSLATAKMPLPAWKTRPVSLRLSSLTSRVATGASHLGLRRFRFSSLQTHKMGNSVPPQNVMPSRDRNRRFGSTGLILPSMEHDTSHESLRGLEAKAGWLAHADRAGQKAEARDRGTRSEKSSHHRTTATSSRVSDRLFFPYLKRYQSVTGAKSGPLPRRHSRLQHISAHPQIALRPLFVGRGWGQNLLTRAPLLYANHLTLPCFAWAPPSPPQSAAEREYEGRRG